MSLYPKTAQVRRFLTPQVRKDFAGVRGRVKSAVAAAPRSVTFSAALKQVQMFNAVPKK